MTITYQLNGGGGTNSDCTPALGNNEKALLARDDNTAITRSVPTATVDELSLSWTSEPSNPNNGDWPSGNYTGSLEVLATPSLGGLKIRLSRINSACTSQQVLGTSSLLVGTGVKSFVVNIDPSAGAIGDRFQMIILGTNNSESTAENLTITVNDADSFMDGPWATVVMSRGYNGSGDITGLTGSVGVSS